MTLLTLGLPRGRGRPWARAGSGAWRADAAKRGGRDSAPAPRPGQPYPAVRPAGAASSCASLSCCSSFRLRSGGSVGCALGPITASAFQT